MSTVLVTGGAGFIGSHLVPVLRARGHRVRILDVLSPQVHGPVPSRLEWLDDENVEFIRGSVTDRRIIGAALEGVQHVVHLAAETGTGQSMYEISHYNDVNSQGTAVLLDVLTNNPSRSVERLVLASSRSVYGEGAYVCPSCDPQRRVFPLARTPAQLAAHRWEPICAQCSAPLNAVPTRETDAVRPASIYAATKYAQEDLVRVASEAMGIGFAILRLQNVYGEGQSLKNPYTGILSIFSTRIRRGLNTPVFEDGRETRDFVHVSDVVQAMVKSLEVPSAPDTVINVGSGVATSVHEVAGQLSRSLGCEPDIVVTGEYRIGDIRHNVADVARMQQFLQHTPTVALQEGLSRFCAWVQSQPLPQDLLGRANEELRSRKLMGS